MRIDRKVKVLLFLIISIALLSSLYSYMNSNKNYKEISYKRFLSYVENGQVEKVELDDSPKITGKLKNGNYFVTDNPRTENFKENLLKNNIKVKETNGNSALMQGLTFILFLLGIGAIGYFLNNNMTKQAQKEMAVMSNVDEENFSEKDISFKDVAGNEEAIGSLKELVDFIQNPDKYDKYGARIPRGVLLYGPPGTGKTLLAKALAGEAKVPFYSVAGSDFIQVYAGLGASRIRTLFKKAKESGKSVIFIDEIDALGKKRKGNFSNGGSDESDRTLNALLTEMSGFKENEGIIVVAATNRIDTLDEALLRPGRFDRQIEVGLPDVNARYKILSLHSKNKPLSDSVNLKKVAHETVYFSGAMLENLMNESAMLAAKNNDPSINMNHIDKAFYTVLVGEEKKDRSTIPFEDKKITAYHEAGHALITKLVSKENRVTKVSIIPSTRGMGGFSMNIPPDKMYQTKNDIKNNIMVALGGRAAEEVVFGENNITTGASSDLKKATEMSLSMIGIYGMDKELGLLNYESILGQNMEGNKILIDRIKDILDNLYSETKKLIIDNIDYLDKIASLLLEKEVLDEEDMNRLVS
ncbi:ATP-dependent zinc metalloprotease FtsH [Anaerosalibacter bizertensis]|uniref:ATP-dependent zinc metalloprotease FtsH n=1 Tax=Anaerosalibacter bizertensis TaxID=932217 RepID=A0A9Q4AD15_9FIRM|nr:ATP-dependent zinc metalloprotease FtsH [Anaerosalibacter bizertensis]MBV1818267.1 ATP-dependent zinc metalloprotease FtsH [Bacteroidales bacterium MSK.15.36]MCB5560261.1 ATP-dependent zinc metalloprotease FtsH [Anaerosalibacter bizertensis]MCG4565639.1 ATP-dependent zinc metalloprotease FtsH [Anaerosalibacter bizertensis]MCG4582702.1 ATP-dependent zinc metalloprotease FtsH [Anaerosalibacter bizertensis]MCG4585042.1 ATP-dependent zinc metalloprotease FtsH [Anaerosalibacter bizertensis]